MKRSMGKKVSKAQAENVGWRKKIRDNEENKQEFNWSI